MRQHFPGSEITFEPHAERQALVDTWPADVDCLRAREDWGYEPRWTLEQAMREYIVPTVRARYGDAPTPEGAMP